MNETKPIGKKKNERWWDVCKMRSHITDRYWYNEKNGKITFDRQEFYQNTNNFESQNLRFAQNLLYYTPTHKLMPIQYPDENVITSSYKNDFRYQADSSNQAIT